MQTGNFATTTCFLLPSNSEQIYAGTFTRFMEVVGVHSNSIVTSFNDGGIIPYSGVASNDRSKDGSGKFFTFFNLEQ